MMIFPVKRFDVNMRSGIRVVSLVFLLAAMLFRFWHVRGPIDNFSAWRQTETAYMTWRMYQESPPEVMLSKVPYRGAKDVHLAEFPVQPLLMAYGYKLMGRESMVLARLFSLSFFCLGAYLLFLIVSRMLGRDIGWICLAIYSWLPLGIGYSRAVHVDFCVLFFCYAYLYFGMRFFDCRRWCFWMLSSFMATIAFAMKAPYCFFLGLPLLIYVFYIRERRSIYNLMLVCALFIIPLLAAIAYNAYRMALEASEQESLVYCMKWTPELSRNLFFGSFELRLDWERWKTVLRRTWWWVLTPGGGVLAVLGLAYRPRSQSWCGVLIAYGWYLGAVVYALTVFAIFSSTHDYYSLPLLAPAALAISFGIYRLVSSCPQLWMKTVVLMLLIGVVAFGSFAWLCQADRFAVDQQRFLAGESIGRHTQPGDLVLSLTKGRTTGWSDPRILYFAKRRGWASNFDQLDEKSLDLYRDHGAAYGAVLVTPLYWPLEEEDYGVLSIFPKKEYPLSDDAGNLLGYLVLVDLENAKLGPANNE